MTESRELESGDPRSLQDGRYLPESVLGEGSMGRTYLAKDIENDHYVAVKALYPSRLADFKDLELFQREAATLKRLDHPQIPAYVDSFDEGEGESTCYYLVQSYVDGETLREIIQREQRFDETAIVDLAVALLNPLDYMHGLTPQVVHRDIKPDNIILKDGLPTLVDFGAVREVVRLTMRGGSTVVGSYGYMPPEQLMGRALPATDLYAVGITLLECLTRRRPGDLTGNEAQALIAQTNVSEKLKRILRRLCSPGLSDRYGSVEQVLADLQGRSLVHASQLEGAIKVREKEAEKALKKASRPGVHIGYIAAVIVTTFMAVVAGLFMVQALSASFQSGFLVATLVSGVGLLLNLVLASRRYLHDAWEPPKPGWKKTQARVDGFDVDVDPNSGNVVPVMKYSFPTKSGRYKHTRFFPQHLRERVSEGSEFVVYYPEGRPEHHEAADLRRDDISEMERLYDRSKVHTPE